MKRTSTVSTPAKRQFMMKAKQRKKRSVGPYTVRVFGGLPFPPLLQNTLRYGETVGLTVLGGGYVYYGFRANGLYDPNYTGTGHQPRYFDQLSAIYDHWCVVRSRITVRVTDNPSTNGGTTMCLFVDDDNTPGVANQYDALEKPGVKICNVVPGSIDPGQGLKQSWDGRKTFGSDLVNNPSFQGTVSADPTEQSLFFISLAGTPTNVVYVTVVIEYDVVWSEFQSITGS